MPFSARCGSPLERSVDRVTCQQHRAASLNAWRAPATLRERRRANLAIFSVRLNWEDSIEYLKLDFDRLAQGDPVETAELWKDDPHDHKRLYVYSAKCEFVDVENFEIHLRYGAAENSHLADYEIDWGLYRFKIDPSAMRVVAARIQPTESVKATGIVLDSDLFDDDRQQVSRIKRRGQEQLKQDLLHIDGACAISGETWSDVLDAAHVEPASEKGPATIQNAFLLRADLHRLFDAGKLRISPTGEVELKQIPVRSSYHGSKPPRLNAAVLQRVREALERTQQ
jgi:hypothetical protein